MYFASIGDGRFDRRGTSLVRLGQRVVALGGGYNPATTVNEEFILCANIWRTIGEKMLSHRRHFATVAVPAKMFHEVKGGCEGV